MACSCKNRKNGAAGTWKVRLKGGLEVPKSSKEAAEAFAKKTPGSTVVKSA